MDAFVTVFKALIFNQSNATVDILVDSHNATLYHVERRPSEAGRNVIVNTKDQRDVLRSGWNVRTGVQEYGGTCAAVHDGVVFFSNYADGRIYKVREGSGEEPIAVTPGEQHAPKALPP